jgi:hypothetical protein
MLDLKNGFHWVTQFPCSSKAALLKNKHRGAPVGKGRLEEVKPDESGKPIPVVVYGHSQSNRYKNE